MFYKLLFIFNYRNSLFAESAAETIMVLQIWPLQKNNPVL